MKNIFAILSAVIVFASCSDKTGGWHSAPELQTAHELMQERPDSALKVLIGFDFDDSTSRSVVNEYQILVAEALYKNDYQQTNAQAVIDATAYYDSVFEKHPKNIDLAFETARAHYYKAVGETEKDDIVEACADYLKAADIMEDAFPEIAKAAEKGMMGDYNYERTRFICLIYERLGQLMLAESYCEPAVENFKKSLSYARLTGNAKTEANILKHIGNAYYLAEEPDSAMSYYKKTLVTGSEFKNICEEVIATVAFLYNDDGKADSAKMLLRGNMSSRNGNVIIKNSLVMGNIFYDECEYDSAAYYYSICFENGNEQTRMSSAQRLSSIYDRKGEADRAAFYSRYATENAIKEINRSTKAKEIVVFYNSYKEKKQRMETIRLTVLYSVVTLIIAGVVFAVRSIMHRRQKVRLSAEIATSRMLIDDVNWRLSVTSGKLESARRKISEQQDAIKSKEEEIDSIQQSAASPKAEERLRSFRASDICATIMSRINELDARGIKLTELKPLTSSELSELRQAADSCLNRFTSRMMKKFPQLNSDDITYICLYLLDISDNAIAGLMDKNGNTVWYRAKKLRSILDISPKESISHTLYSFV
ncbi:MAG: hypothetical protein MJZ56_07795 [Bacteroidales bacterium]|nr:hypothetical protein [Bacteroidales bacterium]